MFYHFRVAERAAIKTTFPLTLLFAFLGADTRFYTHKIAICSAGSHVSRRESHAVRGQPERDDDAAQLASSILYLLQRARWPADFQRSFEAADGTSEGATTLSYHAPAADELPLDACWLSRQTSRRRGRLRLIDISPASRESLVCTTMPPYNTCPYDRCLRFSQHYAYLCCARFSHSNSGDCAHFTSYQLCCKRLLPFRPRRRHDIVAIIISPLFRTEHITHARATLMRAPPIILRRRRLLFVRRLQYRDI